MSFYVDQLALILGTEILAERVVLYAELLADLTPDQLHHGFQRAAQRFKPEYGRTFPAPSEIREWADEIPISEEERQSALQSDTIDEQDIPHGWTVEDVRAARKQVRQTLPRETDELAEPPAVHPDFAHLTVEQRRREFQQMILESWANGSWGPQRQKEAGSLLDALRRGEVVDIPSSMAWLLSRFGRPERGDFSNDSEFQKARAKWAHDKAVAQDWLEPTRNPRSW